MSFFYEGNAYLEQSYITNSTISNDIITISSINTSSIDMLSSSGNYQNITSVKDPINRQDAATKSYVDSLGIVISDYTLTSTSSTLISTPIITQTTSGNVLVTSSTSPNYGSYVLTITNLVSGGPSAIFNITKNQTSNCGAVMRTVASPGNDHNCTIDVKWPANSGILLYKTNPNYDGSYRVKLI